MRKLILAGLLVVMALPACAAKRVTVAQLEKSLAADLSSQMADADVARRVADLELTERLTDATLDRFANHLPLGPRTALALQLAADQSAFLEPPANELPATQTPDPAMQQRMMDLARGYVVRIWPHLPNFFVTRTTAHFDDSPQILRQGEWPVRMGLHLLGTSRHNLAYRDGQEILDTTTQTAVANAGVSAMPAQQDKGMTSRGEFGPELTIVLTDSAKGKVDWSHWEQTSTGLAAVYSYSVPSAVSHFEVSYCCIRQDVQQELHYGSTRRGGAPASIMDTAQADTKLFEATPGYHGTLAIDPNTGAILRITIEAELKSEDPISKAATMVQYGPVTIGDRTFMFPVRSMALSVEKPLSLRAIIALPPPSGCLPMRGQRARRLPIRRVPLRRSLQQRRQQLHHPHPRLYRPYRRQLPHPLRPLSRRSASARPAEFPMSRPPRRSRNKAIFSSSSPPAWWMWASWPGIRRAIR
jgi:hypothetical protein